MCLLVLCHFEILVYKQERKKAIPVFVLQLIKNDNNNNFVTLLCNFDGSVSFPDPEYTLLKRIRKVLGK